MSTSPYDDTARARAGSGAADSPLTAWRLRLTPQQSNFTLLYAAFFASSPSGTSVTPENFGGAKAIRSSAVAQRSHTPG